MASIHVEPMIRKRSFRNECAGERILGFRFNILMVDTKGNFLSCVENFRVTVNQEEVPKENVFICLRGKQYCTAELDQLSYVFWALNEDAEIVVYNGLSVDELSRVDVNYGLRMSFVGNWEHRLVIPKSDTAIFERS